MPGVDLYAAACANCHGIDGTGAPPSALAFEEEVPDFTDCSFASREPDADWVAVAHEGGPVRGFSGMMPAFGGILGPEPLERVMAYVRTLCGDARWPRGELNVPRAMFTEKAYPEDELVYTIETPLEGDASALLSEIVYEKRFGPRSQIEVVVPFGVRQRGVGAADPDAWVGGLGDVVLGLKHTVLHSLASGTIVSVGGEVKLPTGKTDDGFGGGTTVLETFAAVGKLLPSDGFLQAQAVFEAPTGAGHPNEVVARGVIGKTFTSGGPWGRAWSPMLETIAARDLVDGEAWSWDLAPQIQVSLNTRQHVLANVAVLLPVTDAGARDARLFIYVLWDWFDGGFFEGW